jgi:hypothetical protein
MPTMMPKRAMIMLIVTIVALDTGQISLKVRFARERPEPSPHVMLDR